jgi:hypothetical protein
MACVNGIVLRHDFSPRLTAPTALRRTAGAPTPRLDELRLDELAERAERRREVSHRGDLKRPDS